MVIVVKNQANTDSLNSLMSYLNQRNMTVKQTVGENRTILGLIGDTVSLDVDELYAFPVVESVRRIQEPYKLASRTFRSTDTVVDIGDYKIGGGNFQIIAGPCSVESEEQILEVATSVKKSGVNILRGGAYKPRSSPYAFQGLMGKGLELLSEAKVQLKMPIVSEIMSIDDIDEFEDVDVIQVGARNMQNFKLLKELGCINKPILLKRGLANTIEEFLMSAEYIMAGGNEQVILCERGIRTFETATRNTLDISAVPVIKRLSHLPVIIDPSHASGKAELVEPLALASVAVGADGLMIETHNNPQCALCDGAQSLNLEQFDSLVKKVDELRKFVVSHK